MPAVWGIRSAAVPAARPSCWKLTLAGFDLKPLPMLYRDPYTNDPDCTRAPILHPSLVSNIDGVYRSLAIPPSGSGYCYLTIPLLPCVYVTTRPDGTKTQYGDYYAVAIISLGADGDGNVLIYVTVGATNYASTPHDGLAFINSQTFFSGNVTIPAADATSGGCYEAIDFTNDMGDSSFLGGTICPTLDNTFISGATVRLEPYCGDDCAAVPLSSPDESTCNSKYCVDRYSFKADCPHGSTVQDVTYADSSCGGVPDDVGWRITDVTGTVYTFEGVFLSHACASDAGCTAPAEEHY